MPSSRVLYLAVGAFLFVVLLLLSLRHHSAAPAPAAVVTNAHLFPGVSPDTRGQRIAKPLRIPPFDPLKDGKNLGFTDEECSVKFPGGFAEIERAAARGHIGGSPDHSKEGGREMVNGYVKARVYNGHLYIVKKGEDVWHRMDAILHQIDRALLTSPDRSKIPNIEFTFLLNDHPASNVWSFARSDDPQEVHDTWLMPDYSFFSWPEPHIGAPHEVSEKIAAIDRRVSWKDKEDAAVWRGTKHWNAELRGKLLEVAKDKPWSDVQELDWETNALKIEEFCKYKFLIYTEGVTYSGRLRYFQSCRSVIITPKLHWNQAQSPLITGEGPNQNIIYVRDDWSDLESTIQRLRDNPDEAERIANNTVRVFRDWYLTPAFEACYWRRLFKKWKDVTDDVPPLEVQERGTSFENYILMGKLDWKTTA